MFEALSKLGTNVLLSRYRPRRKPTKLVAIVVPIFDRPQLTDDEEISLRHLRRFLGEYDKFLLAPKGLDFELPDFKTIRLSRKYYGSGRRHTHLLYQLSFYERFKDYKYILMHHLDALVFSDELQKWCETEMDYVGAPWMPFADAPENVSKVLNTMSAQSKDSLPWSVEPRVGTGGLGLMKVETAMRVLRERYLKEPSKYWRERVASFVEWIFPNYRPASLYMQATQKDGKLSVFAKIASAPFIDWRLRRLMRREEINLPNDIFWSFHAVRYLPSFRVPDWRTGLRFAFENGPRDCFQLNDQTLPFGCHRWPEYREFWEPYLIKDQSSSRAAF